MKRMQLAKAIEQIDATRGRHRVRTLYREDLLQALDEARRGNYGLRAGGTVANSYGYSACRMRLVAIRRRSGSYAVLVDWGNAKKGSSTCPLGGQRSRWERTLQANRHRLDDNPWWILSGAEADRALALRLLEARQRAAARWPEETGLGDVLVRLADSIAAGNCPNETARVAAWWPQGTEAVTAAELRAEILRREPTLAPMPGAPWPLRSARGGCQNA